MAYIVDPDKTPRTVAYDLGQHWLFKIAQELIQSDQHQAPNTKGKNKQIQLSSHKMNRSQELVTLSQKSGNALKRVCVGGGGGGGGGA